MRRHRSPDRSKLRTLAWQAHLVHRLQANHLDLLRVARRIVCRLQPDETILGGLFLYGPVARGGRSELRAQLLRALEARGQRVSWPRIRDARNTDLVDDDGFNDGR